MQADRVIADTELRVSPLCLGTNVFGWTVNEQGAFALLDAYVAAGGNFIDTADQYPAWVPGLQGGESEAVIGRWLAKREQRGDVVVATKVGRKPGLEGLSAATITRAVDGSLHRLGVDYLDLYYAHWDDPNTPLEETLGTLSELVANGKVRYIGLSNYSAERFAEALAICDQHGSARLVALQPHYNLVERKQYETELAPICEKASVSCVPYFALAKGFLAGKYRRDGPEVESVRAERATAYLHDQGIALLSILDEIAEAHSANVAAVSLAWLAAQPTVAAPIASARTTDQLAECCAVGELVLSAEEIQRLNEATAKL